jgi:hypothetical protein
VLPAGKAATDVKRAVSLFPAKALRTEWHHIIPKYVGGAIDDLRIEINAAGH